MRNIVFFTFLALCLHPVKTLCDTDSLTPAELFRESFTAIDSMATVISGHASKSAYSQKSVDSTVEMILDKNKFIVGLSLFDNSGSLIKDYNRTKKTVAIKNVASRNWFTIPKTGRTPFFGGVVQADSKFCLLKSYPLALATHHNISNGVLVVLIDATQFLERFGLQFEYPVAVTYKSVKLYRSSPETTDLPFHTTVAGYDDLEISYNTETLSASIDPIRTNQKPIVTTLLSIPLLLIYGATTLVLGLLSFFCGRYYRKQEKYRKMLEMEYEKISKEQQKQIHDRALSQVYCEVKRQIETHEIKKIEDEIRHKIELDIEDKMLVG